jgi:hypothetical protein
MDSPEKARLDSDSRFLVTDEFAIKWFRHGHSVDHYETLKLFLADNGTAGQLLAGPVPYVRMLPWPSQGNKSKKHVMYVFFSAASPMVLLNYIPHSNADWVHTLNAESAVRFWEDVHHILEVLGVVAS